jgi:hypothetical protein
MSDTPKKIELTIMKDSASEFDMASRETFMSSAPMNPFFFIISMAGFM